MMPFLHSLYSPLFWLFLLSLSIWVYLMVSHRPHRWGRGRKILAVLYLAGWLTAWLVSTPTGSKLLHDSLTMDVEPPEDFRPDYILVAAMGYVTTSDPDSDVLNDGTSSRVATAARWHAKVPGASLVMQGYSGRGEIAPDHQGRMMKQFAIGCGVPSDKILLEPQSRNTAEHVEQIMAFDFITPETPIGVVSSDWHLRRIRMVFEDQFNQVAFMGAPGQQPRQSGLARWLPSERDLLLSKIYLREWVAILWYGLRD